MGTFNYDKDKFKDVEGLDTLIEQAINYGTKNAIKQTQSQTEEEKNRIAELEQKLNMLQNQSAFDRELMNVDKNNRQLILDLTNGDINKLESVKTKYANLFKPTSKVSLEDVLTGNLDNSKEVITITDKDKLKKMYENGDDLTETQLSIIFSE